MRADLRIGFRGFANMVTSSRGRRTRGTFSSSRLGFRAFASPLTGSGTPRLEAVEPVTTLGDGLRY